MNTCSVQQIIDAFNMQKLEPEGGYWAPCYRSSLTSTAYKCACGSILYLITPDTFSHFHKLTSDEIFHFCAGSPVEQLILSPDGKAELAIMGTNFTHHEKPVSIVPAEHWQAARLVPGGNFALLAATTVPAYTDECVKHASTAELVQLFPRHKKEIVKFA